MLKSNQKFFQFASQHWKVNLNSAGYSRYQHFYVLFEFNKTINPFSNSTDLDSSNQQRQWEVNDLFY